MAINLNDNIFSSSPKLLDAKWGPFPDLTTAYASVGESFRKIGMFAIIAPTGGGAAQLWWYKNNINNLVLFSGNSSVQVYDVKVATVPPVSGETSFPPNGSVDVIYIDKSTNSSYYWTTADGGKYELTSTTNVEVYNGRNNFPTPGFEGIIYIAADTDYSYLWDEGTGTYIQITNNTGASAYDIWISEGNTGTKQDFLDSLTGPIGPTGSQGETGPQGETGAQGPTGATGSTGPQGSQGLTGETGATGASGPQGIQGIPGTVGPAGLTWRSTWAATTNYVENDAVGYDGASYFCFLDIAGNVLNDNPSNDTAHWALLASEGAVGPQGPTGATGDTGATGPAGEQGPAGPTGATGPQGFQGDVGPQGPQGIQGITGLQGIQGIQGAQGPQGNQGVQGADGPQGEQGTQGEIGPAGATGNTGPQGIQGEAGPIGPAGLTWREQWVTNPSPAYALNDAVGYGGASYFCYTVPVSGTNPTVDTNHWALLANIGATGLQGPTGATGATGPAGPTGPEGPQGPRGFQGNPGETGAQGPVGPQGPQGTQGPQGNIGPQGPGGSQTLQEVLTEGNEATGINIKLINDTAIELDNGSLLRKGTYNFGNYGDIIVSGITDAETGLISWRDITGIKWSDLNGTYIKTSVAVTPTGYTTPNQGMHTPVAGTYNYYLQLLGNPSLNGIAYFLAPGNRSGWGSDPDDDANTDPPATYWRLCVLSDWPITYFTNPSTDPYNFPTTGWVPVDDTIPNNEGGEGYDYIATYDTGFTATFSNVINGSGGISRICSIGYEDMWQAGIRYVFGNSGTIREATNCFDYVPNSTFDINRRFAVGSRWVLDNGDTYICTDNTSNAAIWSLLTRSTGFEQNFLLMGG